jgi:hypothetical protein
MINNDRLSNSFKDIFKTNLRKRMADRLPHFYEDQRHIFSALLIGPNLSISSKNNGRSLVFSYRRKASYANSYYFIKFLFRRFRNLIPKRGMWSSVRTYSCVKTRQQYFIFRSRCLSKRVFKSPYISFNSSKPLIFLPSNFTRAMFNEKVLTYLICDSNFSGNFLFGDEFRCIINIRSSIAVQPTIHNLIEFIREEYGFNSIYVLHADHRCYLTLNCSFNNIKSLVKLRLVPPFFRHYFN